MRLFPFAFFGALFFSLAFLGSSFRFFAFFEVRLFPFAFFGAPFFSVAFLRSPFRFFVFFEARLFLVSFEAAFLFRAFVFFLALPGASCFFARFVAAGPPRPSSSCEPGMHAIGADVQVALLDGDVDGPYAGVVPDESLPHLERAARAAQNVDLVRFAGPRIARQSASAGRRLAGARGPDRDDPAGLGGTVGTVHLCHVPGEISVVVGLEELVELVAAVELDEPSPSRSSTMIEPRPRSPFSRTREISSPCSASASLRASARARVRSSSGAIRELGLQLAATLLSSSVS